jgi:hypothetical protein
MVDSRYNTFDSRIKILPAKSSDPGVRRQGTLSREAKISAPTTRWPVSRDDVLVSQVNDLAARNNLGYHANQGSCCERQPVCLAKQKFAARSKSLLSDWRRGPYR